MQTARPTWRSRVWIGAMIALLVLAFFISSVGVENATAGWVVVAVATSLAAAVIVAAQWRIKVQRRRHEDALAGWAAERAAQGERLRIAADLHDLVSHGLGLITVRAAAALSVDGPNGEGERAQALADVERVSRETTTELRRMLTVLRDPDSAPRRPTDSIRDLPAIVDAASKAGLTVTLACDDPGEMSAGVQTAVCAVVREALTNVARHAGPSRAQVIVRQASGAVIVDITDAGPGTGWKPQSGAGHGLRAMRERVEGLGGTLIAEGTGEGFRVHARIPEAQLA